MDKAHLLLVEDDPALGPVLRRGLEADGYRVTVARTAGAAYDLAVAGTWDVMVLDVMLPDGSGLDTLRALREAGIATPSLCLTARGSVEDRVNGLDAGADDYLVKPFAFEELLARLRALQRRPPQTLAATHLRAGNLRLEPWGRWVTVAGRTVDVPPREFDVLEYLLRQGGVPVSRGMVLDRVWGSEAPRANVAEATVSRLRRRLAAAGWDGRVVGVPGVGYRLEGPGERQEL